MNLELHPDASQNFAEKANALLLKLLPVPQSTSPSYQNSFSPDRFLSATITDQDIIGEMRFSTIDSAGVVVAKYFKHDGRAIGLSDDSYKLLVHLSQEMQRTKQLSGSVSISFLTDLIFDWMKDKYLNATQLRMTEYVLGKCQESVQELEVWVPIAMLYIQSEIPIGRITLKTITRQMLDHWRAQAQTQNASDNDKIKNFYDKEQKALQGLAAATIKVHAEPKRAFEIALAETEKSVGLLRFFSASNFYPEVTSYCTALGKENRESTKHLIMRGRDLVRISTAGVDSAIQELVIDNALLARFKTDGLDTLNNLLLQENRTEFQETLLNSLLLYSRHTLAKNLADKLVYILVALESILLKNENEPIQQNIGERMAFVVGQNINERKSIIRNLKEAYRLRSSFVHHGHTIEDLETVRGFMLNAWKFFFLLIRQSGHLKTKAELIDAIEERKLT